MKYCPKCCKERELSSFYVDSTRPDKKNRICKECSKLSDQKYTKTIRGRYTMYKKCAKYRGYPFLLTLDEFISLWDQNCSYCGEKIEGIGLDRIDNNKGYIIQNVVPCCEICNYMKQSSSKKAFISQCKKIIKFCR